jgi:sulfate transport system permease protein
VAETGTQLPGTRLGASRRAKRRSQGGTSRLGLAVAVLWLTIIVLLPLAAIFAASLDDGVAALWDAITAPTALAALKVTVLVSVIVTVINAFLGTLVAWVLVRDEFRGKAFVNALIDLPFALPTIVASIVLLALYGPQSPVDIHLNATRYGVIMALMFVTLPFVVRAVQPVLLELDRDVEQAAASLGAGNRTIFLRVVLPALVPAILGGAGLAFTRAIGEFGSVVLIGGNIPKDTQVASQYIKQQIEVGQQTQAAAVAVALLAIAFVTLLILRLFGNRTARREAGSL